MDFKAFKKIYGEAIDALNEHRVVDAISLTKAIQGDCMMMANDEMVVRLHSQYEEIVGDFIAGQLNQQEQERLNQIFCDLIGHLQRVRAEWLMDHMPTAYSRMASRLTDLGEKELADQLRRTTLCKLEDPAYEQALDAAFGIAWCCNLSSLKPIERYLPKIDSFAKRVLVGALLLGVLDCFSLEKIDLLLKLGTIADNDLLNAALIDDDEERKTKEAEAHDLLARVTVALTLITQHYGVFFEHFTDTADSIRGFLQKPAVKTDMPLLLNAFACQSMTARAGKRVDDIMSIIKGFIEEHQPRLGSSSDDASDDAKENPDFEVHVTKIDLKAGKRIFKEMMSYAEDVDSMRQRGLDVNHSNFIYMKRFSFFDHPAHWFYPFDLSEPNIQQGVHHPNGKLDLMTLSIMDHNRFCDSDRYSYACMMAYLRRDNKKSISDSVVEQISEMQDEDDLPFDLEESAEHRLNPYVNFCQTCYRFFHSKTMEGEYAYAFAATDDILLPLSPFFEGNYTDFNELKDCVEAFLHMGDSEHAIILLDHIMEHYGTTAYCLQLKGRALMQLRQWRSAIGCFQQELLLEENPESQLATARCYEALQDWDSALPLLLEENQRQEGKDANLIEEIARCLLQLKRWDDAVQRFFQLEFMGKHLSVCQRGIGWCSLHQGKYERAEQYYRKLTEGSKRGQWEDYINLGHALWLQGRTAEAVAVYRQFATAFNRSKKAKRHSFRHWTEAFQEDARSLLAAHLSARELAIMQDAIAMK